MKRDLKNMDFFTCPVIEVGDMRSAKSILDTGLPHIPADDGTKDNAALICKGNKLKKALKILGIVAVVALFIGVTVAILISEY